MHQDDHDTIDSKGRLSATWIIWFEFMHSWERQSRSAGTNEQITVDCVW